MTDYWQFFAIAAVGSFVLPITFASGCMIAEKIANWARS